MHKLIDYICDELEELENKLDKDGGLSMSEVQYMDLLAHTKKNLLKDEYSGRSYARRNRYSRADDGMIEELNELMHNAKDDKMRMEFQRFIRKLEQL